jgi:hypothetical protein
MTILKVYPDSEVSFVRYYGGLIGACFGWNFPQVEMPKTSNLLC